MKIHNILKDLPDATNKEQITTLFSTTRFRFERIVSLGQSTPEGFWYDQNQYEFVLLLQGSGALRFEGEAELKFMSTGDYIQIPPHCRHRVEWTDPDKETIWLAVHF